MSSSAPCGCDEARAGRRYRAWLEVLAREGECTRDGRGECMGPGFCAQASAAAALDGAAPIGFEDEEDEG